MDWCSLLCRYGTSREEIVLFFFRSGGHRRLNGGASGQEFCCHIKFAVDTTHLREREPPPGYNSLVCIVRSLYYYFGIRVI